MQIDFYQSTMLSMEFYRVNIVNNNNNIFFKKIFLHNIQFFLASHQERRIGHFFAFYQRLCYQKTINEILIENQQKNKYILFSFIIINVFFFLSSLSLSLHVSIVNPRSNTCITIAFSSCVLSLDRSPCDASSDASGEH